MKDDALRRKLADAQAALQAANAAGHGATMAPGDGSGPDPDVRLLFEPLKVA